MLEHQEDMLLDETRQGTDTPDSDTRRVIDELRRVLAAGNERVEQVQTRMRRLEDELAEGREKVAILEEQLQEMLD
jgi:methyl-accepting chemotaxis protein